MPPPRFLNPDSPTRVTRNRLPHCSQRQATYFITFRLADSLPATKLRRHRKQRESWVAAQGPRPWSPETEREYYRRFFGKLEHWLDMGSGECLLEDPANAGIIADCLQFFEGQRSELHAWVIMPNHVHVLLDVLPEAELSKLVMSWKGFSARRIHERMGRCGSLWQRSYFDRIVRDWDHFARCVRYIRRNPQKAKLREGTFLLGESELARRFR